MINDTDSKDDTGGRLFICATPIGNLGDITARVVRALSEADAVLAEDTRVTRRLLSHLDIHVPLERCDAHSIRTCIPELITRLQSGERLALVSDAGTPGISDPGMELVSACREADLPVEILPGASALLTALVGSGFTFTSFYFGGFLPRKAGECQTLLSDLAALPAALVFYESPHRLANSLAVMADILPTRQVAVARELTKLHEEYIWGTANELLSEIELRSIANPEKPLKGEIAIVVAPPLLTKEKRVHHDKYAKP
ncbi:MAG: 16S rRNA (cytidine(1402)-2'-O)-methyltransferase [Coriobacteriales bacterium]|nr:16S rRNA (cytidine(1402)-2'-O)-methyltransferase [Coriobacteriales bacterium]